MEAGFIPAGAGSPPNAVTRVPGLKRGRTEEAISDRVKLERVLGLTVGSNAALDCDPNRDIIAYPAGCTIVLYNVRKNSQSHVLNSSRKSVTCVAFSADGRHLAAGECGHSPSVKVWDLQDPSAPGAVLVAELNGHTHGVSCIAFSTSSKYLVSVGSQHDMIVNVWDWRAGLKLASNKVSSRVKAVSFSEDGKYFVTVGFRHVKFWYLEYSRNVKVKEPVPLMGRSAILGEQKDNEFCDVKCARGSNAAGAYAITRGGLLCQFNARRLLDKWVELRTPSANCMAIGENYIFVGCAEGIIRCFSPETLAYVTTLPRTHYLGVDVAQGVNISHMFSQPAGARYPDAVALTYDERNHRLSCVYNDHSLYVWDVRDIKRVGKSHSALYHSACIWGVEMATGEGPLPPGAFLTCSSDDTVRVWSAVSHTTDHNIYSNELSRVLYIDPELKFLKDVDLTASGERDKTRSYDDKIGVRCVRVSSDGAHVASGDRAGNVRVHSAARGSRLHALEAHDAEVLCLEYSPRGAARALLASASRDRLIHVFDVDAGYQLLQTVDDHSSSITAVRFLGAAQNLQMVSCGADKTILFRQMKTSQNGGVQFSRVQNVSGRTTLYDMEVDAGGRHILTACQDRNVRVYSSTTGRHTKTFRGTTAEEGTLIKVALDSSGIYMATSSTDKILSVYDYYSGECMATMFGHSEIVTGLRFTPDCQHLISASGDGCIFIWRVPHDMVVTMKARLAQQAIRLGRKVGTNGLSGLDSETDSHLGSPPREIPYEDPKLNTPLIPDYTFRIGQLPSWAKKSLGNEVGNTSETPPSDPPFRGKWATRINTPEKRVDSDGSKDSSLDSGTDTRFIEKRREQTIKQVTIVSKPRSVDGRRNHTDDSSIGSLKYEDHESTEHDGDIEDISDGERTSSSERCNRTTYYPGNNDDDTPSEFMVNAMDAEELRRSVRRCRRAAVEGAVAAASLSGSGSGHDTDDDEVSTPSGDNAERHLLGSCESVDAVGRRRRYIKSAFDSLSGADDGGSGSGHNKSISSLHSRAPAPRVVDPESTRRREELNRRIMETRRQLENVTMRSNLKSSQSTTDLSYVPERDSNRRNRPVSMAVPNYSRLYANHALLSTYDDDDDPTGMRRAISLSDLAAKPVPAPRSASTKSTQQQAVMSPSGFLRPPPRAPPTNNANIKRSVSTGVLNQQSDSESEGDSRAPPTRLQALTRPTISSMNKASASATRKRSSSNNYGAANLTSGPHETSSEEDIRNNNEKPAIPPRPRIVGRSGSDREMSAKAREVTARLAATKNKTKADEAADKPLSPSQLLALSDQLTKTAHKVARLYSTMQAERNCNAELTGLESAMLEAQQVLSGAVGGRADQGSESDKPDVDKLRKMIDQLARDAADPGADSDVYLPLFEQCSSAILKIMQSKVMQRSPKQSAADS